jgi:tetratricopeptide (TPR) repeat protein
MYFGLTLIRPSATFSLKGEGKALPVGWVRVLILSCLLLGGYMSFAEDPAAQHFQTGLVYERLGRYDEAYTELQLAFALNQDDAKMAVALGVVACRLGHLDVAQRALERSIAVDSNSVASYFQLGLIYEKNGLTERALDAWHRFASQSQDEPLKSVALKHIQHLEAGGG